MGKGDYGGRGTRNYLVTLLIEFLALYTERLNLVCVCIDIRTLNL